jgi:hypothetical protein
MVVQVVQRVKVPESPEMEVRLVALYHKLSGSGEVNPLEEE